MPATLADLLDFETEVERAFTSYLTTTLNLPAVGSDSNTDLQLPRVEVVATVVSEGPHVIQITTGTYTGRHFFDQKRVRVQIDLVYSPSWGQSQGSLRGNIRVALSDYDGILAALATNNYLYLAKATLMQTDGGRSVNDADKSETISTTIEGQFFIVPAALAAL